MRPGHSRRDHLVGQLRALFIEFSLKHHSESSGHPLYFDKYGRQQLCVTKSAIFIKLSRDRATLFNRILHSMYVRVEQARSCIAGGSGEFSARSHQSRVK